MTKKVTTQIEITRLHYIASINIDV